MQISVIVPTYRPANYIWQCLDGLEAQTMDKRLWECIVVLNGCCEPWKTEIEEYLHKKDLANVRLIQTDIPGVSNARNIGLDGANGEYITFIDDDDYVSPTFLEELARIASCDTLAASYTIGFSDKQAHVPYYLEHEYERCAPAGKQAFFKARKYFGGPCMKLIHRDMIGNNRFDTHFKNGEDSLFMFAISPRISFIQFTSKNAIYYRRIRIGSASNTYTKKQALKNGLRLIAQYTRLFWGGKRYRFTFYVTRILGVIHSIIKQ